MKKFALLFALVFVGVISFCFVAPYGVAKAEGEGVSAVESISDDISSADSTEGSETGGTDKGEESTEFDCKVVLQPCQYGDMLADKEGGNVGDVVTLIAKPYSLFGVESVTVNGVALTPNEDGNYNFTLVEGENVVVATFKVNQEEISYVLGLIEKAKEGDWEDIFSLKNLFTIISWVISLFTAGGLCITLLKKQKIKAKTAEEISAAVEEVTKGETSKAVNAFMEKILGPSFDMFSEKLKEINEMCASMARCMVLAQENTPEARLAIIQELSKNNEKAQDLAEEVKKIVHDEMTATEKEKQDKIDTLKALEEKNNALGNKPITETQKSSEGRY